MQLKVLQVLFLTFGGIRYIYATAEAPAAATPILPLHKDDFHFSSPEFVEMSRFISSPTFSSDLPAVSFLVGEEASPAVLQGGAAGVSLLSPNHFLLLFNYNNPLLSATLWNRFITSFSSLPPSLTSALMVENNNSTRMDNTTSLESESYRSVLLSASAAENSSSAAAAAAAVDLTEVLQSAIRERAGRILDFYNIQSAKMEKTVVPSSLSTSSTTTSYLSKSMFPPLSSFVPSVISMLAVLYNSTIAYFLPPSLRTHTYPNVASFTAKYGQSRRPFSASASSQPSPKPYNSSSHHPTSPFSSRRVIVIYSVTPTMVRQSLSNLVSSAFLALQLSPVDLSSSSSLHIQHKLRALEQLRGVYLKALHVEVVEVPPFFSTLEFIMLLHMSPFVEAAYPETAVSVPETVENVGVKVQGGEDVAEPGQPKTKKSSIKKKNDNTPDSSLVTLDVDWLLHPPSTGRLLPNDTLYSMQWYLKDSNKYSVKAESTWALLEVLSKEKNASSTSSTMDNREASFPRRLQSFQRSSRILSLESYKEPPLHWWGAKEPLSGSGRFDENDISSYIPPSFATSSSVPSSSSLLRSSLAALRHRSSSGSPSTIVAVLDTGCDFYHAELADQIWVNEAEGDCNDGIDGDLNGYPDDCYGWDFVENRPLSVDTEGHGTASAGIIAAAANNGKGLAGLCWTCKVMCIKALTSTMPTSSAHIIMAIDYAIRNGAKISNNSWGSQGVIPELLVTVARARQFGHLFVAAAGNENQNNDDLFAAFFPASHLLDNVLSVGSIDFRGAKATFSNYGRKSVDLFAPGTAIATTQLGSGFTMKSGTSYSSPLVAAAAGILLTLYPFLTYGEVKKLIMESVTKSEQLTELSRAGGTLNVYQAVKAAVDYCSKPKMCTFHSKAAIMESWASMCHNPLLCSLPAIDWETFWDWTRNLSQHYLESNLVS